MLRILRSNVAKEVEENIAKGLVQKPDQQSEDSRQENPQTHITDKEKEQKLAQYKLWLSWIGQRQEALDQMELKLRRMRKIAREAMEPGVSKGTQEALNQELQRLEKEVQHLDQVSREKGMMLEEMQQAMEENETER